MTEAEKHVLREAALHAGVPASEADRFCEQVAQRIRKGAEEYGELGYLERTFPECEAEAIEEQHDAGGWTSLGLRLLDRDVEHGFPSDVAELVRLLALQGVAQAHQSARAFDEAIELYREHEHKIKRPPKLGGPPSMTYAEREKVALERAAAAS